MFILYDYDSNTILGEPLKSRGGKVIAEAFTKCHACLTQYGHSVEIFVLDNECSHHLKRAIETTDSKYEFHRRNAAERGIRTYKNHLLAGLATCDPDFPIDEWDRILFQCELTLNLLRTSRVNPKLSAWAYIFGVFDFNKSPLAPPGSKVVFHWKAGDRPS